MSFKNDFLARVANQAATSASIDAVETAPAPAITETAPAATEVVEVVEEVPAVEPQPEVQSVKAEVPAKAAPQPQPQQQPKLNAPAKGKKSVLVSDLKSLPEKLELSIIGPVSTLRYIELDEDQYHVEEMKAVTAIGKLSIVATVDLQGRIVRSYKNGVMPFVEIVKRTTSKGEIFYQVKNVIEGIKGLQTIGGKFFRSAEQIYQWVINGLSKEGLEISPEMVAKAYNSVKLITVNEGIVVVNAREIEQKFTVVTVPTALNTATTATATNVVATSENVPAATATSTATTALNTATATNAAATTNATNVTRK